MAIMSCWEKLHIVGQRAGGVLVRRAKNGSRAGIYESLDLIVIANLRKLEAASGRAIIAQLLASFSTVTPSRLAALRAAIATGDAYAINMEAHTLKGSSANMGARRMARLCGDLEMLSQTDDLTHAASILVYIEIEFACVRMALEQAIGKV